MATILRQIIARNGGTTASFRDQIESCRNPDYFADRDIRSMAAWEGYRYLLRTDTESDAEQSVLLPFPAMVVRASSVLPWDTTSVPVPSR